MHNSNMIFTAVAVMTLDGKIAKDEHDPIHWGSPEDKRQLDEFVRFHTDLCVVGNTSYRLAKSFFNKFRHIPCLILTRQIQEAQEISPKRWMVNTENFDIRSWCLAKKMTRITILGGAKVYTWCLNQGMLNHLRLTVEPVVFGSGIHMFQENDCLIEFQLQHVEKINDRGTMVYDWMRIGDEIKL